MLKEFREFAMRGNVIDMAVGIIIGAAFGKIVSSLVEDVLMPPLGLILGKVDFSNLYIRLTTQTYPSFEAAKAAGAPMIRIGLFLNAVINFLIVAVALFLLIRVINRLRAKPEEPAEAPTTRECPYCLSTVPLVASRCAYCTSELPAVAPTEL